MIVVFLGPPCSGKGTQAETLAKKLAIPCFSTGELFRQAIASQTELGLKIKDLYAQGCLIDNETVNEVMTGITSKYDSFIFDGYPRNLNQAQALAAALKLQNKQVTVAINLELDDETILSRMQIRVTQTKNGAQRADDTAEAMQTRLRLHHQLQDQLLNYYKQQDILSCVDGLGSIEDVQQRIEKLFSV